MPAELCENLPVSLGSGNAILHVKLTPKSSVARVQGIECRAGEAYLKVQVAAPPADGEANAALIEVLSAWLDVPKSKLAITSGRKSRLKSVAIPAGKELIARLFHLLKSLDGHAVAARR